MIKIYLLLFSVLILCSCQPKKDKSAPNDVRSGKDSTTISEKEGVPMVNLQEMEGEGEAEFMDDMEFMPPIEDRSYLGIGIGSNINQHQEVLRAGSFSSGDGTYPVHYVVYGKDTLGYVYGEQEVETIHIWDSRGATHDGIRVGMSFSEVKELLEGIEVHGSELESRVHVFYKNHLYRLAMNHSSYDLEVAKIPDTVRIQEIIVQ